MEDVGGRRGWRVWAEAWRARVLHCDEARGAELRVDRRYLDRRHPCKVSAELLRSLSLDAEVDLSVQHLSHRGCQIEGEGAGVPDRGGGGDRTQGAAGERAGTDTDAGGMKPGASAKCQRGRANRASQQGEPIRPANRASQSGEPIGRVNRASQSEPTERANRASPSESI